MIKLFISTIFFLFFVLLLTTPAVAQTPVDFQEEMLEGQVVRITDFGQESFMDDMVPFQDLVIKITSGSLKDKQIELTNSGASGGMTNINWIEYKTDDQVKVYRSKNYDGEDIFIMAGKLKRPGLISLVVLFVITVIIVGRLWGLLSLLGMVVSFSVIFKIVIPMIISGQDPVLAATLGSLIIIPATFYISHGFNWKTHVGVISTLIALIFTGILAVYFVGATHLTGFASEEAGFLQVERQGTIDIRGLLIAGIIIGVLGILDDVTIGQASTVQQLKHANPSISMFNLFKKGMKVGQDHISSMVNTLVLVYSGSALPLLLLFFDDQKPFSEIIEFELIAEEVVRVLVGSIGLVLVAPLATLLAAYVFSQPKLSQLVPAKTTSPRPKTSPRKSNNSKSPTNS